MSETYYTPSEARICIDFCNAATKRPRPDGSFMSMEEADAAFSRWLATHDAEVRAGVVAEEPELRDARWSTEDRRAALGEAAGRWAVQDMHDRITRRDQDLYAMGARQGFALGAEWWKLRHPLTPEPQSLTPEEINALPIGSVVMTETHVDRFGAYEQRVWQKFGGDPDWQFGVPRHEWQSTDGGFERVGNAERHRGQFGFNGRVTLLWVPVKQEGEVRD